MDFVSYEMVKIPGEMLDPFLYDFLADVDFVSYEMVKIPGEMVHPFLGYGFFSYEMVIIAGEMNTHDAGKHAVLQAFIHAYNSHEDIILSPDDIWLLVCISFSTYVNDNSEQLRHLFVDHEGQKILTVLDFERSEPDWEDFLERMRLEIGKHVKSDVNDVLANNFSTTMKVESLLSCLATMTTFKKYFKYRYGMVMCGIRNVHFMGTLAD
ncbi:unnamed protein product [Rotaria sp. Silwood1]|nr:unnamed protein product [Rotaria sp. Silwood1]